MCTEIFFYVQFLRSEQGAKYCSGRFPMENSYYIRSNHDLLFAILYVLYLFCLNLIIEIEKYDQWHLFDNSEGMVKTSRFIFKVSSYSSVHW